MNIIFVIITVIGILGAGESSSGPENYLSAPPMNEILSKKAFHPFQKVIKSTKVAIEFTPIQKELGERDEKEVDEKMMVKITPLYNYNKRVWRWEWLRSCCGCCCGRREDD